MTAPFVLAVPSKGRLQENADAFFARAKVCLREHDPACDFATAQPRHARAD